MNSRKLLSTGLLLFAGMVGLQAQQRKCDMAVTLLSPAEGATVNAYAQFNITVNIVNNGPDALLTGDTLYYNTPSMFAFATLPYVLQQAIPSGGNATVTLALGTNVNENSQDETSSYCVKVIGNPNNVGAFIDTAHLSNNTSCHTVTFKAAGPTAIEEQASAPAVLKIYPNPAGNTVTFGLEHSTMDKVAAVVRDIAGRECSRKDFGKQPAGTQNLALNISALLPGIYFVELQSPQGRVLGRFVKQ